ncbi:MAG: rhomboid family intramembrane serine protease [Thermoguttaceae bacterium]|jgi:membrane associated rhomboid family serine protease
MGFYDRDYYREEDERFSDRIFGGLSVTFVLIVTNLTLFLADMFLTPNTHLVTHLLAMYSETIFHPVYWFEFITYGFVHDPSGFYHIFGNMLVLFFFGPHIERKYGKLEFFIFYMVAVLAGGVVWGIQAGIASHNHFQATGQGLGAEMLGASGAVAAVVILFACNYPHVNIYLFGILPMPAWALGVMYVLMDTFGAFSGAGNIAHIVHIAGTVVAALYFFLGIRFTKFRLAKRHPHLKRGGSSGTKTSRPTYTWNVPESSPVPSEMLDEEVNRILRKIKATGEASLTDKERGTLMYASREYQKRRSRS